MGRKRITVIQESQSGRNKIFRDNYKNAEMTRSEFVKQIKQHNYPNYHIRKINGIDTPISNPDKNTNNNLG